MTTAKERRKRVSYTQENAIFATHEAPHTRLPRCDLLTGDGWSGRPCFGTVTAILHPTALEVHFKLQWQKLNSSRLLGLKQVEAGSFSQSRSR